MKTQNYANSPSFASISLFFAVTFESHTSRGSVKPHPLARERKSFQYMAPEMHSPQSVGSDLNSADRRCVL